MYKINKSKESHATKEDAVNQAAFDYSLDDIDKKILLETGFVINNNGTIVELKDATCG